MASRTDMCKKYGSGNIVFPYTIGRIEYVLRNVVLAVIFLPAQFVAEKSDNPILLALCVAFLILGVLAGFWFQIIPRIRDLGWNTKLAWLMLVPGVNVVMGFGLFFLPGK